MILSSIAAEEREKLQVFKGLKEKKLLHRTCEQFHFRDEAVQLRCGRACGDCEERSGRVVYAEETGRFVFALQRI